MALQRIDMQQERSYPPWVWSGWTRSLEAIKDWRWNDYQLLPNRPPRVRFPYNDHVIITLNIINYNIHYILINDKSLNDVLFYDVSIKIGLFLDQLERRLTPPWSVSLKAPCPSKDLSTWELCFGSGEEVLKAWSPSWCATSHLPSPLYKETEGSSCCWNWFFIWVWPSKSPLSPWNPPGHCPKLGWRKWYLDPRWWNK